MSIVTEGTWATVQLDGETLGTTPAQLSIPVGRRRLTLLPEGSGAPRLVDVIVTDIGVARVRVDLRK